MLAKIKKQNLNLSSEIELQKMILGNTSEVIKVMKSFYRKAFREILSRGFDLSTLDTVKAVLSETHLVSLANQIA